MEYLNINFQARLGFFNSICVKRVAVFCLVGSVAITLSGCAGSLLSGSGPDYKSLIAATDSNQVDFEIVDLTPMTILPYMLMPAPVNQHLVQNQVLPLVMMPGDVLTVEIAETEASPKMFASLSSGGTQFENVRVTDQGEIDLPYVGSVKAQGLTPKHLSQKIKQSLMKTLPSVQVRVTLTNDVSSAVLVSGAIKNPGRYSPLKGPMTLADVIALAGGATAEPHLINVTVRSPGKVESFSYQDVLYGKNQLLSSRSEVVLQRNRESFIAMGAVGTPGLFDMPSSHSSLLQVLGVVGGLQQATADPSGVFIFRRAGFAADGKPIALVFRLDMSRPEAIMLASAFQVKPEDALYVTNAGIYEAQKIISPIVQMIILGNTVTGSN